MLWLAIFMLLNSNISSAQQQYYKISNNKYFLEDKRWVHKEERSNDKFEIDPKRLVVRLKSKEKMEDFDFVKQQIKDIRIASRRMLDGFYLLECKSEISGFSVAQILEKSALFDVIEFEEFGRFHSIPNDPNYSSQWNMPKTSTVLGWDIVTEGARLAIIDSGTRVSHEDLVDNIWVNPAEDRNGNGKPDFFPVSSGGDLDGVDNDGNGYVDDLCGWDFVQGDNLPEETFQHGTIVTGIASAKTNNSRGIAGVAGGWSNNRGTRTMILRCGGNAPSDVATAQSIEYAARNGARVINLSLSVAPTTLMENAINLAVNTYGVVVVAASGNLSGSISYPAYRSDVLAVGATDQSDNRRSYSNFGSQLDVVAPDEVPSTGNSNDQSYVSGSTVAGTSFAAPQVAGVAALIRSVNPNLSWLQVRDIITSTASKVPAMGGQTFTNEYGFGHLNAYAAVKRTLELYGGTISGVGNLPFSETWNMQPNVAITVAQGTSINTTGLVFQRATGSNWGGIYINSNNSTFNSCQFLNGSGGSNYMVFVRGYDVFFNNCTFSGATDAGTGRGISTDLTPSGQRSRVHLTNCVIQGNRTGVVLYNCDAFLNNCTIQNNTSVGLYQLNAVNVMWNSEIMNNVTNIGSEGERAGVENYSNSVLSMAAYSYNTVKNNLSHEVLNDYSSFVYAGLASPSYNSIYDINADYSTAGRKYIINQNSSHTVQARTNYWGGSPVPEMFSGAVDYANALGGSLTGFSASPDNIVMQQNSDSPTSTFNNSVDDKTDDADARRERIVALLGQLRQTPDDAQNHRRIAELHGLALLDKDDKTGQRAAVFQTLSDWENRTVAFRQANADAALRQTHPTQRAGEQAALAMLNLLIKQDRYDEARQRLAQAKSIVERKESQVALLMSEATLEEQAGRFQSALARIQDVRRLATELSGDKVNRYDLVEQTLRHKLTGNGQETASPTVATSFNSDNAKAASVELSQNYPNPFNPSTVISYQLPVSGQVSLKIYDMLGREVQTLVNETQAAGRYSVRFNASGLSSGTYFYKLQANGLVQTKKLTLLK